MRIRRGFGTDKDKDIDWESYKIDVNNTLTKDENAVIYLEIEQKHIVVKES